MASPHCYHCGRTITRKLAAASEYWPCDRHEQGHLLCGQSARFLAPVKGACPKPAGKLTWSTYVPREPAHAE